MYFFFDTILFVVLDVVVVVRIYPFALTTSLATLASSTTAATAASTFSGTGRAGSPSRRGCGCWGTAGSDTLELCDAVAECLGGALGVYFARDGCEVELDWGETEDGCEDLGGWVRGVLVLD